MKVGLGVITKNVEKSFFHKILRFLYNRLALFMCYLLDIDLALFSLLLLWEVKLNKSWNTFFAIKVLFYVHDIIQSFATFQYQLH